MPTLLRKSTIAQRVNQDFEACSRITPTAESGYFGIEL
jgi:hypothetical protein